MEPTIKKSFFLTMNKNNILLSVLKIASLLSKLDRCHWYITGGVALRLHVANQTKSPPDKVFRNHSDIDLLIFSEDIEKVIPLFLQEKSYVFFDSAFQGLQTSDENSQAENHHYAITDKKHQVEFGIFELIIENDGFGYVYTNKYLNKHPLEIFCDKPISIEDINIPLVSPEWCYYNANFLKPIRKNDDVELIESLVNQGIYKRITTQAQKKSVLYKTYKEWIEWRYRNRLKLFNTKKGEKNG